MIDNKSGLHADTGASAPPLLGPSNPLFQRNLLAGPSIIQFLCDRVESSPDLERQLQCVIDKSKTDTSASIAATNAITILIRVGISCHSADLRGVKIPGADLSEGQFDSAQFQGADMRAAILARG
ncbi:hypothetical protein BGZ47_008607 [Haplosporangium gracile]|nr:hypothetical protein BGZ47_008607 [Haplosporangium gracile]